MEVPRVMCKPGTTSASNLRLLDACGAAACRMCYRYVERSDVTVILTLRPGLESRRCRNFGHWVSHWGTLNGGWCWWA
jgi:hypothetical protein